MENLIFFKSVMGMQHISRWRNRNPRFPDNYAAHSYRCGFLTLLLSQYESEVNPHVEIDVEQLVCKALFHDFKRIITGPVRYETKTDSEMEKAFKEVEREGLLELLQNFSADFKDKYQQIILYKEADSFENRFLSSIHVFEALLFCHREVLHGDRGYFSIKLEELEKTIQNTKEFKSIQFAFEAYKNKNDFYDFLMGIFSMEREVRWDHRINLVYDDDAIHSYRTTMWLIFAAFYLESRMGIKVDLVRCIGKGMVHDFPEIRTGDLPGPFKRKYTKFHEIFKNYELQQTKHLISWLPDFLRDQYSDYTISAKSDDTEGLLIGLCDAVDALYKTDLERSINSHYEKDYFKQVKEIKEKYGEHQITYYFVDEVCPNFDWS